MALVGNRPFEFNNSDGDGGSGSLVVTPINPGTITPINY